MSVGNTKTERVTDIEAIRERVKAADSGPWMWRGPIDHIGPRLVTRNSHRGEHTILDFCRVGMQGAQPRFQRPDGLMDRANTPGLAIFEVCPEAVTPDDPRVYRNDVMGFRNGNADFIANSRQDVDDLLNLVDRLRNYACDLERNGVAAGTIRHLRETHLQDGDLSDGGAS